MGKKNKTKQKTGGAGIWLKGSALSQLLWAAGFGS